MKKIKEYFVGLSLIALLLFPAAISAQSTTLPPQPSQMKFRKVPNAISNSYIVVLNDAAVSQTSTVNARRSQVSAIANSFAQQHGGRVGFVYETALVGFSIELPNETAAIAISRSPRVKFVEEDSLGTIVDTQLNPPWGLDRIDQESTILNGQYVFNATGSGVTAYVIDTGIRSTHLEFGGRASIAADFVGSEFCNSPGNNDCNSHGTHVAGTIGGATFGVAKGVTIRSIKVCNSGGSCAVSATVNGINFATNEHNSTGNRAVANISLRFGATQSLDDAVRNSLNAGVTYAIAAGNDSANAASFSPQRVSEALIVGASDINNNHASFSNFGSLLDLYAPGVDVLSATNSSNTSSAFFSGTSMAAPHVAGAVALYLQGRTPMTGCSAHPKQAPSTTTGSAISTCPDRVNQFIVSNATRDQLIGVPSGTNNRLLFTGSLPTAVNPMDNNRFFVWEQYVDFLNREPDSGGFSNWIAVLNACPPSDWPCLNAARVHAVRGFIESGEFKADKPALLNPTSTEEYNGAYVTWLYRSLLRREPDADGFATWFNFLNSTGDYSHVVHGFINSHEYRRRFGPHP
ncbi:MAG TPA: S8 family serine peptidase [Pyrinomonadaceae bacterium]|nr:S8 family serine peptidase [Pyrinomonadaceae bacterium]